MDTLLVDLPPGEGIHPLLVDLPRGERFSVATGLWIGEAGFVRSYQDE